MSKRANHKGKISTNTSEEVFGLSPFSSLNSTGLPETTQKPVSPKKEKFINQAPVGKGERLEIRREKSGRGGKTVTTIKGFPVHICQKERSKLLKILKSSLGTGGTWNTSTMELQGDRRDDVFYWFKNAGFSPVLAGG
jgi:translation initiation factor 1